MAHVATGVHSRPSNEAYLYCPRRREEQQQSREASRLLYYSNVGDCFLIVLLYSILSFFPPILAYNLYRQAGAALPKLAGGSL